VRWALASVFRAELMDLLPAAAEQERAIVLDGAFMSELASCVRAAGIGRSLRLGFDSADLVGREGQTICLFGLRPELVEHRCVEAGQPPERVLELTRQLD
jgi:hypothetical protein